MSRTVMEQLITNVSNHGEEEVWDMKEVEEDVEKAMN